MRLAIKTCTLDMPYTEMLDFCAAQGVRAVEIGTGNWSPPKPPAPAGMTRCAAGGSPCVL